ncbi:TPA: hypothetical protein ACPJ0D_004633 [Vibrio diabolicus]
MENTVNRTIKSTFRLDTPKFNRVVNILKEKFSSESSEYVCKFSYSTKKGRHFTGSSVDDVVNHDNSVDNSIYSLEIELFDSAEKPKHHAKLEFDKSDDQVKIKVDSISSNFADDLFDELEEQIARTSYKDNIQSIRSGTYTILFALLLIIIPCALTYGVVTSEYGFSERLSRDEIVALLPMFESAVSTEDKTNAIFQMYKQLLENNNSSLTLNTAISFFKDLFTNFKFYIFVISILIISLLVRSLLKTSLGSVFLWGDYKQHVEVQEKKRAFLINILVGSVLAGLLVNSLFFALT